MISGAQIAHLFLENDLISEFIITEIHRLYKGDVYFNLTLLDGWYKTALAKTKDYTICKLTHDKDGRKIMKLIKSLNCKLCQLKQQARGLL